jgi:hypothetical protein
MPQCHIMVQCCCMSLAMGTAVRHVAPETQIQDTPYTCFSTSKNCYQSAHPSSVQSKPICRFHSSCFKTEFLWYILLECDSWTGQSCNSCSFSMATGAESLLICMAITFYGAQKEHSSDADVDSSQYQYCQQMALSVLALTDDKSALDCQHMG